MWVGAYMLYDVIWFTSDEFHLKIAKLIMDGIQFVHHCLD